MNLNLNLVLVDGAIDVDASVDAAREAIVAFKTERETESDTISAAVASVFDTLAENGTRANVPYIVNQALVQLGVAQAPTLYKTMYDRVYAFLKDNSAADGSKMFIIGRGKGNGVKRVSDLTEEELAKLSDKSAAS